MKILTVVRSYRNGYTTTTSKLNEKITTRL